MAVMSIRARSRTSPAETWLMLGAGLIATLVTLPILTIVLLSFGYARFIRVMREEVRNRARLETEVKIAQDIQQSLIPSTTFQNTWCEIAGMTSSATEVAGDYFDIVPLSDHQLVIAIADVA